MAGKLEDPFSSKFILPEHVAMLANYEYEKSLIPQPILEPDEMAEINTILYDSIRWDFAVTIKYWVEMRKGLGEIRSFWGVLKFLDRELGRIKVVGIDDYEWIDLRKIVTVQT